MRNIVRFGALVFAVLASPALAAPLTEEAAQYIQDEAFVGTAGSKPDLRDLKFCRKAEQKAAQYDRHPFFDAVIANCFGTLEARLGNKKAACDHHARAIARYQLIRVGDPYYSKTLMDGWRQKRTELGC